MDRKPSSAPVILTILLILALCCLGICLVLFASGAAYVTWWDFVGSNSIMGNLEIVDEPISFFTPAHQATLPGMQEGTFETTPDPKQDLLLHNSNGAQETLRTLQKEIVPINDPIELAERLGGKQNVPATYPDANAPYDIGDSKAFWVINVDTNENFQITATVRYRGEHIYFWIENGVMYSERDLTRLGDTFDNEIYPTTRAFFGSEWSPGVDHDPRIHIVYAGDLGQSLAGYYSSADQLHPEAHQYSNTHEMFLINSDIVDLGGSYIYGTLAHEYQHMIHWNINRNQETWLNEGFSMLAEIINGYDPGGFDHIYIRDTDLQLTDWGDDLVENRPHYGAAMLFTTYIYDQFGAELTKALVANQQKGMTSIDQVLAEFDIRDTSTGQLITSEDVFTDWAVTNFLGDSSVADGRYHYSIYPDSPTASPGIIINTCPAEPVTYDVAQYGVDYIEILCKGNYTLSFNGNTNNIILPASPYSGNYYFWSNMGDHSNMSLEQRFDFTGVQPPIEMTYQTWFDIEKDYDYVYISASTDGIDWQILNTTSCTTANPSGNSYGCGLNGKSSGWQRETVNLNAYADQQVTLRFDYVTDAAVNGDGFLIDDIRIDAIEYFTDFEDDDGGWIAEGFVRIQNSLPQTFTVSIISFADEIKVSRLILDDQNRATITIDADLNSIVLVVSGTTPFTRQRATYQVAIN